MAKKKDVRDKSAVEKKRKRGDDRNERVAKLKQETRHAALGVVFFALGLFFFLAGINYAGPAGAFTYRWLSVTFGWGYYLISLSLLLISISFLRLQRPNFVGMKLLGGAGFFISALALLHTLWADSAGGIAGRLLAWPFIELFDVYVSVIFIGALLVISTLVLFDTHITLEPKLFGRRLWGRSESEEEMMEEEVEEKPVKIVGSSIDEKSSEKPVEPIPAPVKNEPIISDNSSGGITGALSSFISFGKSTGDREYVPPPLNLLAGDSGKPAVGDVKANSNIIKRTFQNFGINVEMDEISIGPSVTRYALKPAEGVKLSRIIALNPDLSLALAAHPLRIEAPIPGKSLVGIEIPNRIKSTVGLATLIGSKEFADSHHPLFASLGRGISGIPHFFNIAKAPHVLVAGTTGSGKSVAIHTIITSLLYRNSPDKMRFILIDPKRVELTLYNKIPHLLTPVITDAKKAILALRWAAKEMDRRYDILENSAVKDIQSYHKNVLEPYREKQAKKPKNEDGSPATDNEAPEAMPYIVVIIDELADLMSSYPRELEASVVRLAQMSRAVGIHLILSTQRPSVEVITGLIKANIPCRIALQVASQIDSRTIIDMPGAEKLLGAGDMLYLGSEMNKPVRIQSAFISEGEVKSVAQYLAKNYADELPQVIDLGGSMESTSGGLYGTALDDGDADDDMYEAAREVVLEAGKASASFLQRRLKVGYARAARLIDMLEERGVVGPGDGAKPREILGSAGHSAPEPTDSF